MKYKVTESQKKLISELRQRRGIKEQDFIMQSFSPTANEGMEPNRTTRRDYDVSVTILGTLNIGRDADAMDDGTFFATVAREVKEKLMEAFNTPEITITSLSSPARGEAKI